MLSNTPRCSYYSFLLAKIEGLKGLSVRMILNKNAAFRPFLVTIENSYLLTWVGYC